MDPSSAADELKDQILEQVLLPGEDYVIDHWAAQPGSVVRAGETVAFARRKSASGDSGATAVKAAAPAHKRPNRRRKINPGDIPAAAATTKPASDATAASSTTTSTATSLASRLTAKLASKCAETTKIAEESMGNSLAPREPSKKSTTIPILATHTGILRVNQNQTIKAAAAQEENKLSIGYIAQCWHPTVLDGLCVVCGERPGKNASSQVTVSGGITMTVSERESQEMAQRDTIRLFNLKKLSLVLDLDHTLVHATSDARARQYLDHDDVRTIRLPVLEGAPPGTVVDPRHANQFSQHYVKLRPHIIDFLKGVQSTYEVSVYTAGTRQYAEEIAMVLCRSLVGSKRDIDDLDELRHRVKMAEQEYAKHSQLKDNDDKKRKIEEVDGDDGMEVDEDQKEPPKKRKKISFGFSEAGNDEGTQKSDHMTKEKLESMQAELLRAEELERTARELRNAIFGSRVFSRTELGDLGRDVKSLKRIFPCGGTMAAVVDDREDVWSNAKDNSRSTIKGEPPDNLLLVRPYHWQPFTGFADINNASGADLSGSDSAKEGDPSKENDSQLLWTSKILADLHEQYYAQSEKGNRHTVPDTLEKMRRRVLDGCKLVLSGLVPLHKQETMGPNAPRPPIVRYAQSLGAKVRSIERIVHVVCRHCFFARTQSFTSISPLRTDTKQRR